MIFFLTILCNLNHGTAYNVKSRLIYIHKLKHHFNIIIRGCCEANYFCKFCILQQQLLANNLIRFLSFINYGSIPLSIKARSQMIIRNIFNTLAFSLLLPQRLGLLQFDLLLNFGFFVKLVEVVHNDGDWQRNAENPTYRTNLTEPLILSRA